MYIETYTQHTRARAARMPPPPPAAAAPTGTRHRARGSTQQRVVSALSFVPGPRAATRGARGTVKAVCTTIKVVFLPFRGSEIRKTMFIAYVFLALRDYD